MFFPPEILQSIFQILIDYANKSLDIRSRKFTSLQKCLLVNRYWFANAVIFLWRNTIRPDYKRNYTTSKLMISTYILCLSKTSKEFLHEKNIITLKQKTSTPFCDYATFLRDLNFTELFYKVTYFLLSLEEERFDVTALDRSDPVEIVKAYGDDISDYRRILLFGELVRLFTSHNSRLNYQIKLSDWIKGRIRSYPHLQSLSSFISSSSLNFKYAEFQTRIPSQIFDDLTKVISSVDEIKIKCDSYCGDDNEGLARFVCGLERIQLLKIEFEHFRFRNFNEIIKNSSSITENYELTVPSDELIPLDLSLTFHKINGLEITDSGIDSIDLVKSWSGLPFLPFLTSLKFSTSTLIQLDLELYSDIIKKTNGKLTKLGISLDDGLFYHNTNLFNAISTYCPRLKEFDLKVNGKILHYIPLIFQSCKYLENINLEIMDDKNITQVMYKIGKEMPKNLKSFYIYQEEVKWEVKFFHIFLKYCKLNSLENLKFKYKFSQPIENMKEYSRIIKKYIKKGTLSRWSRIKEMRINLDLIIII